MLRSSPPKSQNTNPPLLGPQNLNASIYNRIGNRVPQNGKSRPINKADEPRGGRNFKNWRPLNRKRRNDDYSGRFKGSKRRWQPNNGNVNNSSRWDSSNGDVNGKVSLPHNIAQERLDRIRRRDSELGGIEMTIQNDLHENIQPFAMEESNALLQNESQDVDDAHDITVQIVNNTAVVPRQNHETLERFKMVLDPRVRSAINKLQSTVKSDNYVITSLPISPNCTKLTLNQRFALL